MILDNVSFHHSNCVAGALFGSSWVGCSFCIRFASAVEVSTTVLTCLESRRNRLRYLRRMRGLAMQHGCPRFIAGKFPRIKPQCRTTDEVVQRLHTLLEGMRDDDFGELYKEMRRNLNRAFGMELFD